MGQVEPTYAQTWLLACPVWREATVRNQDVPIGVERAAGRDPGWGLLDEPEAKMRDGEVGAEPCVFSFASALIFLCLG